MTLTPIDHPYPERARRFYFALTNDCNRACPFCSVYSTPGKTTYMTEETFCAHVPLQGRFEAQFEGGEPTLHVKLNDMIAHVWSTQRCDRVVVCTNGVRLPPTAERLHSYIAPWLKGRLSIKLSVNHHLAETDRHWLQRAVSLVGLAEECAGLDVVINLRRRPYGKRDENLRQALEDNGLLRHTNDFWLQRYGLASGDERLALPHLAGENFELINPDGSLYATDLIARSEAMRVLP